MALGYIKLALNDADQSELLAIMVSVGAERFILHLASQSGERETTDCFTYVRTMSA